MYIYKYVYKHIDIHIKSLAYIQWIQHNIKSLTIHILLMLIIYHFMVDLQLLNMLTKISG